MRPLRVSVTIAFVVLLAVGMMLYVQPIEASNSAKAQKFAIWYPPLGDCIGCGNYSQLEIDLYLTPTGSNSTIRTGEPVNMTAAGGVWPDDRSLGPSIKNVTILFGGANPYTTQPQNGITVGGAPPIPGVVLYPSTDCPWHANGAIFSQPYLCGYPNYIVWPKAGTYHPTMTIYPNNGSAPYFENLTTDIVTVVAAQVITSVSVSTEPVIVQPGGFLGLAWYDWLGVFVGVATFVGLYWQWQDRLKWNRRHVRNPR